MRPVLAAFSLALLAGCTPGFIPVRPTGGELVMKKIDDPIAARYRVPEKGSGGLDVYVSARGLRRHERRGHEGVALSLDVEVENRSETAMAGFDPRAAVLLDSEDRRFDAIAPVASSAPTSDEDVTTTPIEPGEKRTFHLEFESNATDDPRDVVPFRVRLTLDYGKSEYPLVVNFVRSEPGGYYPAQAYAYPGYYGPYGYYGWGPYGWGPYGWGYGGGFGPWWW